MGEDVRWRGEILGCPYLCIMWGGGCTLEGGNPGVSLPLRSVWEEGCGRGCTLKGKILGSLHNVRKRMYAGGGGFPYLDLHNVWERMYAGEGKS